MTCQGWRQGPPPRNLKQRDDDSNYAIFVFILNLFQYGQYFLRNKIYHVACIFLHLLVIKSFWYGKVFFQIYFLWTVKIDDLILKIVLEIREYCPCCICVRNEGKTNAESSVCSCVWCSKCQKFSLSESYSNMYIKTTDTRVFLLLYVTEGPKLTPFKEN